MAHPARTGSVPPFTTPRPCAAPLRRCANPQRNRAARRETIPRPARPHARLTAGGARRRGGRGHCDHELADHETNAWGRHGFRLRTTDVGRCGRRADQPGSHPATRRACHRGSASLRCHADPARRLRQRRSLDRQRRERASTAHPEGEAAGPLTGRVPNRLQRRLCGRPHDRLDLRRRQTAPYRPAVASGARNREPSQCAAGWQGALG